MPRKAAIVREHRRQQTEERLATGSAWNDNGGLAFTSRWSGPLYPDTVTALMTKLINQHNKSRSLTVNSRELRLLYFRAVLRRH